MNQPTREEHEELKERVKKLEQQTEPVKVTRIEIKQGDLERTLDNHTALLQEQDGLLHKIYTMTGNQATDIGVLKHEMQGARADITAIKATQSDHGEMLKTMATKDDVAVLKGDITSIKEIQTEQGQKLDQILQLLQQKGE